MLFSAILKMIGGLAMFLYGMYAMEDGLSGMSGGRLEMILKSLSSGYIRPVFAGTIVTALIQSSSAVTVMTAGLAGKGLISYSQSIGIIIGANIGTTATSWLLCLADINTSNILLRLFTPEFFVPVLGMTGVILLMAAGTQAKRNAGNILSGFTTLMTGMEMMTGAALHFADVNTFRDLIGILDSPAAGLLAGMLVTAVIQSSSASIGILQALCVTDSISYACVVPLIMGQNIGTCVTALLSVIGSGRAAKRTVRFHIMFNIAGTAFFMILFMIVRYYLPHAILYGTVSPVGVAVVHTVFNIGTALLCVPLMYVLGFPARS